MSRAAARILDTVLRILVEVALLVVVPAAVILHWWDRLRAWLAEGPADDGDDPDDRVW